MSFFCIIWIKLKNEQSWRRKWKCNDDLLLILFMSQKMQLHSENEKAFLFMHFNLNYGTDSLPWLSTLNWKSWNFAQDRHAFISPNACSHNKSERVTPNSVSYSFFILLWPSSCSASVCVFVCVWVTVSACITIGVILGFGCYNPDGAIGGSGYKSMVSMAVWAAVILSEQHATVSLEPVQILTRLWMRHL